MNQRESRKRTAIIYQSLYLMNLLLIPGIAFIILWWYFSKERSQMGWQRIHLYRAFQLSILAGFLLILLPILVVLTANQFEASVMMMLVYFVTIHAALVMLGMLNISRAMAGKLPLF